MSSPSVLFQPVEGDVIPVSRRYHARFILISLGALLFGIFLVLLYFIGERGIATLLVGSFFSLMGLACLPVFVLGAFSNKRLIIGGDRLQLVKGGATVLGQIPYDNVARVEHLKEEQFEAVGIDVRDRNRSDTIWPGGQAGYDFGKNEFGYEITLGNDCLLPPQTIHQKIAAAKQRFEQGRRPA